MHEIENLQIDILHLDSDTFTPTNLILTKLKRNIRKETILIFDEFFGYPGWEHHEFKAWNSFVKSYRVKYEVIGFTNNQVAFKIK